jgi:YD repeat-containing protein
MPLQHGDNANVAIADGNGHFGGAKHMRKTKAAKALPTAVAAVLLITPFAGSAGQPEVAEPSMQQTSQPATPSQTDQSAQVSGVPLTVTYQYDSLGRLINESYPANTVAHSYDAAGNRTQSSTQ